MPKIESNSTKPEESFDIDGVPYQRGGYELIVFGDNIGINRMNARKISSAVLVSPVPFDQWTNSSDTPFASADALITEAESLMFI